MRRARRLSAIARLGWRLWPLATLPFFAAACDDTSASSVRSATPDERAKIVRAVNWTWNYLSTPMPSGHADLRLRRPALRPTIVRLVVARADPRYSSAVVELRDARGRRRRSPVVMVFERIDKDEWSEKELGANVVAGPAIRFQGACAPGLPGGLRTLACPDPWTVLHSPRPHVRLQTTLTQPISSPDLHSVDWKRVALPGGVCGSSRAIRPRWSTRWQGEAAVQPDVDLLWWNPVWVYSWDKPIFGDLDGDGRDEAALHVGCANGGGMAAGQLAFSEVIFKAEGKSLRVVGIVTPRQPVMSRQDAGHVPLMWKVAIKRGEVIAPEYWYGPYDGTCCPSGEARTTWAYSGNTLRASRTAILRKVWTSPLRIQDLVVNGRRSLFTDRVNRIAANSGLRIDLWVDNESIPDVTKRNVEVTLTITQGDSHVVQTKTIARIPAWPSQPPRLTFRDLGRFERGPKTTLEVDIRDPGATALRYPVIFTR